MGLRCSAMASLVAVALACALFATLGSASVNVAQSGWSWGSPTPQGNTLNSIDFVQGRGYAAGDAGTVLRTDDGGTTWTGLATGTSADLTRRVGQARPGERLRLEVLRDGRALSLELLATQRPADMASGTDVAGAQAGAVLGLDLAPLDAAGRQRLGKDAPAGVLIDRVKHNV